MSRDGFSRVMKTPMAACSRSIAPTRSRMSPDFTWPLFTWTMTRFAWSADTPCPLVYIGKHHRAVDAVVRAFFAFFTACRTSEREALIKRERPPLELVAVFGGELAGTV